ncbi:MAG: T9SS type A sorting domain-containing protein, partial [Saprospiraceae bacterium]|nr:T9SS type A sorting domain-containing protein [Saprospiraceae bacterium]
RLKIQQAISTRLNNSARVNTLATTTNRFADGEVFLNKIYLNHLRYPNYSLTTLEKGRLYQLASQCPREGGRMVYRARALYNLLIETKRFDDNLICEQNSTVEFVESRDSRIEAKELPKVMNIFPNPTKGDFNLFITHNTSAEKIEIVVRSLTGRTVKRENVPHDEQYTISLREFGAGIYLCTLVLDGVPTETQKIVILK